MVLVEPNKPKRALMNIQPSPEMPSFNLINRSALGLIWDALIQQYPELEAVRTPAPWRNTSGTRTPSDADADSHTQPVTPEPCRRGEQNH